MSTDRSVRLACVLVIFAGLVGLRPATTIATQGDGSDGKDSVVGSGHLRGDVQGEEDSRFQVQVSAKSGPDGEDPQGHLFFSHSNLRGEAEFRGKITCLSVVANRALVIGIIEEASPPGLEGQGFLFEFFDNGQPNDSIPDQFNALWGIEGPPLPCTPPANVVGLPVQKGNFVVRDAS